MARGIVIGGRRIKLRFFVILIIALLAISYLNKLSSKPPLYDVAQYGKIITWDKCQGIIVRNEKSYFSPAYGKVDFHISDGEFVTKDDLVAILYKENYNKAMMEDLYKIKEKISDYQSKNLVQDLMNEDYDKVQRDIKEVLRTIQYRSLDGVISEMGRHESQLKELLNKRKDILDKRELSNNYLDNLLEQERDMEEILEEWKVDIISPETGLISFKLDGLEAQLTPGAIDLLTPEQYLSIFEHQAPEYSNSEAMAGFPLYKIVIPDRWHIISYIPNQSVQYNQNDMVEIRLPGFAEDTIVGKVQKVEQLDDSRLIILEMAEGIENILGARNIHIEIGTATEGLMVPNDVVVEKKGKTGVTVLRDGKTQYIEVQVQARNKEWAIISKIKETDSLGPNDKILMR
ncbi:MAG: HlyD family efflux transporter periplasmic adaptor subunit [Caldicoprobacterales bacterium]|jgi:putative membrane fusion protein